MINKIYYEEIESGVLLKDNHNFLRTHEKELRTNINKCLREREDIRSDNYITDRTTFLNNFVYIACHGTFRNHVLISNVFKFITELGALVFKGISEDDINSVASLFPTRSILGDFVFGGGVSDVREIDDMGVIKLCEGLNSINGVETFSSCDGHKGKKADLRHGNKYQGMLFVLYTVDSYQTAELVVLFLKRLSNILSSKYQLKDKTISYLETGYGDWKKIKGLYFEYRLYYQESVWPEVYKFADDIGDHIKSIYEKGITINIIEERLREDLS